MTYRIGLVLGALIVAAIFVAALAVALNAHRLGDGALIVWALLTGAFAWLAARYFRTAHQRREARNHRRQP
ncbi:MAG: hypothetical protein AB7G37_21715 [Solirubrobacteraceae bacterium]